MFKTNASHPAPAAAAAFAARTELELYYCGRQDCPPGHASGPFVRDHFLLHLVTAGRGSFEVHGQRYGLGRGDAFLIYPDQLFRYQADRRQPWSYCWVACNGFGVERYLALAGFTRERPVYQAGRRPPVAHAFAAVLAHAAEFAARPLLEKALLFRLFDVMQRHNRQAGPGPRPAGGIGLVDRAVGVMVREMSRALTIAALAARLGVSRSHLFTAFKTHLGRSPKAHLKLLRLEKSLDYLRNPGLRIAEVARAVGYPDPLHYSKELRGWLGQSPRGYRNGQLALAKSDPPVYNQ
ncbi:MAG: AraC family ligand binding domain-containing protein [Lentisphaeria bacterium]